jgi:hypothetical protein
MNRSVAVSYCDGRMSYWSVSVRRMKYSPD